MTLHRTKLTLNSEADSEQKQIPGPVMTKAEENALIETLREAIHANAKIEIGPVVENSTGIWISVAGKQAYLGSSYQSAKMTAQLSDWWIPGRDGEITDDDREWFEARTTLGSSWEEQEIPMFKEERRTRLAHNIGLATNDELNSEPGN